MHFGSMKKHQESLDAMQCENIIVCLLTMQGSSQTNVMSFKLNEGLTRKI